MVSMAPCNWAIFCSNVMASTSFLARSRGDRDVSCQANVVSDKVGLPQWASPYSLNIESGLARSLLRLLGRPDKLTLDSEKLLPKEAT